MKISLFPASFKQTRHILGSDYFFLMSDLIFVCNILNEHKTLIGFYECCDTFASYISFLGDIIDDCFHKPCNNIYMTTFTTASIFTTTTFTNKSAQIEWKSIKVPPFHLELYSS